MFNLTNTWIGVHVISFCAYNCNNLQYIQTCRIVGKKIWHANFVVLFCFSEDRCLYYGGWDVGVERNVLSSRFLSL